MPLLRRFKTVVVLCLCSAAGFLVAALLAHLGAGAGASCKAVHGLAILLLAAGAINAAGIVIFGVLLPALRLSAPALIVDILMACAYALAGLAALASAGVNLSGLVATSAVMTAIVAFSLQDTLGNVMGGMVIQLERSLSTGDLMRVNGVEGRVLEIRWRQTTIETEAGEVIVMPNSVLMKSNVTIVGREAGRCCRSVAFKVYYDRAPSAVIDCVEKAFAADSPPKVARAPAPKCLLDRFEEDAAGYLLCYWVAVGDLRERFGIDSAVRTRLYYALSREGIKLSIPSRSVVMARREEEFLGRNQEVENGRRLAALRVVPIFAPLSEQELSVLASRLTKTPFAKGEVITKQGARADCLYILENGEAQVSLASADGAASQAVARLKGGDFMGEMALMTGQPRSATVAALTHVDCYRLDREGFADILAKRPEIAEAISLALAKRRIELDSARGGLDEEARRLAVKRTQGDLLSRIRDFFMLA